MDEIVEIKDSSAMFQGLSFDITEGNDERVQEYYKKLEEDKKRDEQNKRDEAYRNSGAQKRFWNESLETYQASPENKKTFEWIKDFLQAVKEGKNTKNIIFISGQRGTGKTHIGCGIVRELGGIIMTSFELCITYDSCRDFNAPETRIQFLKRICNQDVLVIDEIGKGIESIEKLIIPFIVDEFYGSKKLLVFLGNIEKLDFDKIINEDGIDRTNEIGVSLALTGKSHRINKK